MSRLQRWLFGAPVYLYRAGLGFLLGKRMLMQEHKGRKTGARRRTLLEVASTEGGLPVVVSGFGPASDWLRNVRANPGVGIRWGSRRFDAEARPLSGDEASVVFEKYRPDHPRLARFLGRRLSVSAEWRSGCSL